MCGCSRRPNGGSSANWVPNVQVYGSGGSDGGESGDSGLASPSGEEEVSFPGRRPSFRSRIPNLFDIGLTGGVTGGRTPLISVPKRQRFRRPSCVVLADVTEDRAATLDNALPTSPTPEAAPQSTGTTPDGIPQSSNVPPVFGPPVMEDVPLTPRLRVASPLINDEFVRDRSGSESVSSGDMHENF